MRIPPLHHHKGFTLIELLVAVFVFSLIIAVSLGSLFVIINANKKAQSLKSAVGNLNFALEVMTRDIRFGNTYDTNTQEDALSICPGKSMPRHTGANPGNAITYKLLEKQIVRVFGASGAEIPITSSELTVDRLSFKVTNNSTSLGTKQTVLISAQGTAKISNKAQTDFNIQTSVSTRCIDCTPSCTQVNLP